MRRIQRARGDRFTTSALTRLAERREQKDRAADPGGFNVFDIPVIGGLLRGGGTALSGALDIAGRPAQAVSGFALGLQGAEGFDALAGLRRGLLGTSEEREDLNFATFLENTDVEIFDNLWVRNVVGLGLDMLFDPLNILFVSKIRTPFQAAVRGVGGKVGRAPGFRSVGRAFSQRWGQVPITDFRNMVRRGEMTQEQFNIIDENARALTFWASLRGKKAVADEVGEALGGVDAEDGAEALRILFSHHGEAAAARTTPLTYVPGLASDVPVGAKEHIDAARSAGREGVARVLEYFTARFGGRTDDFAIGDIAKLAEEWLGVLTVEGMYARAMYVKYLDDPVIQKGAKGLRKAYSTKSISREKLKGNPEEISELFKSGKLVDDPSVVAAYDIWQTKLLAHRNMFLKSILNKRNGFRKYKKGTVIKPGEGVIETNPGTLMEQKFFDEFGLADKALSKRFKVKGESWVGPQELVDVVKTWGNPHEMHGLMKMVDGFTSMWKPLVTVLFPAFHVRNMLGVVHNNLQGGIWNPKYYVQAIKLMRGSADNVVLNRGQVKMSPKDFHRGLQTHNTVGGGSRNVNSVDQFEETGRNYFNRFAAWMTGQDIPQEVSGKFASMETFKFMLRRDSEGVWARHSFRAGDTATRIPNPMAWGTSMNEAVDNVGRIAHVLSRMDKGDDMATASRSALKFLFAYNEAPPTVKAISSVLPFFRWTYFNVPLQFQQFFLNPQGIPSKLSAVTRGVERTAQDIQPANEALEAENATLPEWMLERHHVVLGQDDDGAMRVVYGFGLPIEDLNKLFATGPLETIENLASEIGPWFRLPMELVADHSAFTGEPIAEDHSLFAFYRRAWRWTENIPGLRDWLEVEKRVTPSGRELFIGNPTRQYLLAALIGRIGITVDRTWEAVRERDAGLGVNLLTGFKVGRVFPAPEQRVPLNARLASDPKLYELYKEYRSIPLYRGLTAEQGNTVARAIPAIGNVRNLVLANMPELSEDEAWEIAATQYGDKDPEAEMLVRLVRKHKIPRNGSEIRRRFKLMFPDLVAALAELSAETVEDIDNRTLSFEDR